MSDSGSLNNSHFDVSAAVIKQLGAELISDEVTAIMELIKNSYDADADWVRINITTTITNSPDHFYNDVNGIVIIEDNGFGMSEQDIKEGWLVISVSQKRVDKQRGRTTPSGRTPLGDKGVGRLSVQRIGQKLEMVTGKKRSDFYSRIAFDWNDFRDDIPLSKVKIHASRLRKELNKEGTKLVISDLIDAKKWEGQSWDKFRGHLSQLIFPDKSKRVFEIYLSKDGESIDLDILNQNLRNLAVSEHHFNFNGSQLTITSTVSFEKLSGSTKDQEFIDEQIKSDKGAEFFSFLTDKIGNKSFFIPNATYIGEKGQIFKIKRTYPIDVIDNLIYLDGDGNEMEGTADIDRHFAQPGPFIGEIRDYYFKETEALTSTFDTLGEFKKIVQNQAGIRIFRDGFGLRPYGLDGNDWLMLGGSQTSGSSYYGLRPGNVIGYISIGAKSNQALKEKTDREGFVASSYSHNFLRLAEKTRDEINNILEQTRRSFNDFKRKKIEEKEGFVGVKDSLTKLQSTSKKANDLEQRTKQLDSEIAETGVLLTHEYQRIKLIKEIDKKVYSDSKDFLDHIDQLLKKSHNLLNQIQSLLKDAKRLDKHAEYLEPIIKNLENQLSDFSQLAGLGLTAEALSHELSNIIDRITQQTDKTINEYNKDSKRAGQILLLFIENVKSSIKSFRKQLSHLAPSLKYVRENKETLSISAFCREVIEFYQEKLGDGILLKFKLTGSDFKIETNKGRLTQVLDNILLNSEYWLKERLNAEKSFKACIEIEVKEPYVIIKDNGYGIDQFMEDRVFQPFVTSKPKNKGRGLGLFIVQQLLEAIGCTIILSNKRNELDRRYIFQIDLSRILK